MARYFAHCENCHRFSFRIKQRKIKIPTIKEPVVSKRMFCGRCYRNLKQQMAHGTI